MGSFASKFCNLATGLTTLVRHGFPSPILWFYGGIGDDLLLTAVARQWRLTHGKTIAVASETPSLYDNNPDIPLVMRNSHGLQRVAPSLCQMIAPRYAVVDPATGRRESPSKHMITLMCESVGLPPPAECRAYLHLTAEERAAAGHVRGAVLFQPTGKAARWHLANNEWGLEKFQEVISALGREVRFVQIGSPKDALTHGAEDMRGRPFRETAAMLAESAGFLGQPGFHMHLARAVDCRSVIVYGGREKPWQSGYEMNINIATNPPCSPCWQESECDFDRKCLKEISPSQVVAAVRLLLSRNPATAS